MQATQIVGFHTDAFAGVDHRLQLVGGAQGQMPAMIHDENAVADLLDLLHVMARVNHRRAFVVKTLNALQNRIAALRIDGDGRLIEENQIRLMRHTACDVQSTKQTSRQFRRTEPAVIAQAHKIQRILNQRMTACPVRHIQRAEIIDILLNRQFIEHSHILRYDADAAFQRITGRANRFVKHTYRALIERQQCENAVNRRGLAGTVRSKQTENLTLMHVKIEIVKRQHIPIPFDQLRHLDRAAGALTCLPFHTLAHRLSLPHMFQQR